MSEAEVQIAEGAFDIQLGFSASRAQNNALYTLAERQAFDVPSSRSGLTTYRFAVSRLFGSGLQASPGVELTRQDAFTFGSPPVARTRATLELVFPLLQMSTRSPAAAIVDAAEKELEASELELRNTRAQSIYQAAAAYWTYLGTFENLAILESSEEKARRLLGETRVLVEADERPSSDLDQLRADLADRVAARLSTEQAVYEARQQLGLIMGLSSHHAASLAHPTAPFPTAETVLGLPPIDELTRIALQRRSDLHGAQRSMESAEAILHARRIEATPKLDLYLNMGYAGLSEGDLQLGHHLPPYGQADISGASGSASLILSWPTTNRHGRGAFAQQEAALRQNRIHVADLERNISSDILVAADRLRGSTEELAKSEEAVELYEAAVANERTKLQLGMSTQFDLILVEERLRNAMLNRVSSQVRYAQALARLRFATGLLHAENPIGVGEHVRSLTSTGW